MKIKSKKGIIIISSLAIIIVATCFLLFNIISKIPNADNVILPLQQDQQSYFQNYKNKNMRLDYENNQLYFTVNGFLNSKTLSFSDKSNKIIGNSYNNFQVDNNFIINLKDGKLTKHNLEDSSDELLFENINFYHLIKNNQKILLYREDETTRENNQLIIYDINSKSQTTIFKGEIIDYTVDFNYVYIVMFDTTQELKNVVYKIDYSNNQLTKICDFSNNSVNLKLLKLQDYLIISASEFSYVYNLTEDKLEEKIPTFLLYNIACKENKIFYIHQAHTTNRLGTFYFEDEDNGIYYYDLATKNPKKISDIVGDQLYIFDDKYVFCVDGNTLYQINIETGENNIVYKG